MEGRLWLVWYVYFMLMLSRMHWSHYDSVVTSFLNIATRVCGQWLCLLLLQSSNVGAYLGHEVFLVQNLSSQWGIPSAALSVLLYCLSALGRLLLAILWVLVLHCQEFCHENNSCHLLALVDLCQGQNLTCLFLNIRLFLHYRISCKHLILFNQCLSPVIWVLIWLTPFPVCFHWWQSVQWLAFFCCC